ncbi:MAG: phosphate acyltransferase PlsX [Clostridia bacterium]|nr:phosphate acyltransferase PlsX [Clostridia bacterium]
MTLIIDAMGGDNAPLEIVKACCDAVKEYNINIKLVGKEDILKDCFQKNDLSLNNIEIINATDTISMEENPKYILKHKADSSMIKGLKLLAENQGDAFVSAGSSGALVVGSTFIVKRINGIKRAAFAPVLPKNNGAFMLLDSGANINCQPVMLNQFGIMGSIYMKKIMNIDNPRVALANIGVEENKGTQLQIDAFNMLKNSDINFIGNVEPREIPNDAADVVVADGFTGNIIVKTYEGVALTLMKKIKSMFKSNILTKIGALLVLPSMKKLKKSFDYNEYGGAPILGLRAPVFKAHGSSDAKTFKSAIRLTIDYVNNNVVNEIQQSIEAMKTT